MSLQLTCFISFHEGIICALEMIIGQPCYLFVKSTEVLNTFLGGGYYQGCEVLSKHHLLCQLWLGPVSCGSLGNLAFLRLPGELCLARPG